MSLTRGGDITVSILADIGNSRAHVFEAGDVSHLEFEEMIERFGDKKVDYICVNAKLSERIRKETGWRDISSFLHREGFYDTMGVDRKALCLSRDEGVFIDAGSAVTVDIVESGIYKGGWLYPGFEAMRQAFAEISPALETDRLAPVALERLPLETKGQISYGIIAPIVALIKRHGARKPLYITGGDGKILARYFNDAEYDEALVFEGMRRALRTKEKRC